MLGGGRSGARGVRVFVYLGAYSKLCLCVYACAKTPLVSRPPSYPPSYSIGEDNLYDLRTAPRKKTLTRAEKVAAEALRQHGLDWDKEKAVEALEKLTRRYKDGAAKHRETVRLAGGIPVRIDSFVVRVLW